MSSSGDLDSVWRQVEVAASAEHLIGITLSDALDRSPDAATRVSIRPVTLRGQVLFQSARRVGKQEFHENFSPEELVPHLKSWFPEKFRSLQFFSTQGDLRVSINTRGVLKVQELPASRQAEPREHDRSRNYLIPEGTPCPFLEALGVMNARGEVLKSHRDKFRQVNRYLEIINDVYPALPEQGVLRVIDFGCGLSYLTFAVHHLLATIHGRQVEILGLDRNSAVITRCQQTSTSLHLNGLTFRQEEISNKEAGESQPLHLAISLHACDTATDDALAYAVKRGAQVILAAPCCQHELSRELQAPALDLLTRHGILKERLAAMATDALRGAALEAAGYRTQIMEFIETEHTPKNLLIRAVLRPASTENSSLGLQARTAYENFKESLGVSTLACDRILPSVEN